MLTICGPHILLHSAPANLHLWRVSLSPSCFWFACAHCVCYVMHCTAQATHSLATVSRHIFLMRGLYYVVLHIRRGRTLFRSPLYSQFKVINAIACAFVDVRRGWQGAQLGSQTRLHSATLPPHRPAISAHHSHCPSFTLPASFSLTLSTKQKIWLVEKVLRSILPSLMTQQSLLPLMYKLSSRRGAPSWMALPLR